MKRQQQYSKRIETLFPYTAGFRCFDGEGGRRAMKVEGSGIIVAGGGSGLGLAAATALRDAGARVGVIDMRQGAWDGPFADADVSDDAAVERAFDALAPVIETERKSPRRNSSHYWDYIIPSHA